MANLTIELDLRNSPAAQNPGYTDTRGTTGYCYKYSGGNFDNGQGFQFSKGSGTKTVDVKLIADRRYKITGISFTPYEGDSTPEDLSIEENSKGPYKWTIDDNTIKSESGHFAVTVKFEQNSNTTVTNIQTDPRWKTQ